MVNMLQKRAKKAQKRKQVVAQLRKHLGDNAVGSLAEEAIAEIAFGEVETLVGIGGPELLRGRHLPV